MIFTNPTYLLKVTKMSAVWVTFGNFGPKVVFRRQFFRGQNFNGKKGLAPAPRKNESGGGSPIKQLKAGGWRLEAGGWRLEAGSGSPAN